MEQRSDPSLTLAKSKKVFTANHRLVYATLGAMGHQGPLEGSCAQDGVILWI